MALQQNNKIMKYDKYSARAEEFINHQEILDTIAYVKANKDNKELLRAILEKGREAKGLSHREAALLLLATDEDIRQATAELAGELKHRFYGRRIVLFAPLYLSNPLIHSLSSPYPSDATLLPILDATNTGNSLH